MALGFVLVESYLQPPGVCYLCKASQRFGDGGRGELIVDTGIHIDFEGRVYVCQACISEMAALCDWQPTERARLVHELDEARARADDVQARYDDLIDSVTARLAAKLAALETAEAKDPGDERRHDAGPLAPALVPGRAAAAPSDAKRGPGRPRLPRTPDGQIAR